MGVALHAKSDSEVTSIDASSPPRSPRRPLYYVQSPSHSQNDVEKMSYGSSPFGSPTHHFHYHSSPINHSRESSTSRFSAALKNPVNGAAARGGWRRMQRKYDEVEDEENETESVEDGEKDGGQVKFYVVCFLLSFVLLFTIFALILWASSLAYKPMISVKSISFVTFNVQAGMDATGVPTDMSSINATVHISYLNPSTFFGVHVTSTPFQLHYFDLHLATGHMEKFYQSRRSGTNLTVGVEGYQVPLYGGIPSLIGSSPETMVVPLNLTFVMRSKAYILGTLVKSKFYNHVSCHAKLRGNHLGKPINLTRSQACVYH